MKSRRERKAPALAGGVAGEVPETPARRRQTVRLSQPLSALGLCAGLRPMAALAACGRWAKLAARRASEGEERRHAVAALSAMRPRPRASGRMSRAKLEQARGRGGKGASPFEAKSGHGGRRAKTERALEQSQQAQRPRSPTGLGAVRSRVTSRDRGAAIIPQAVTPRTETAPRSGSRRPRGCGGGGAPADTNVDAGVNLYRRSVVFLAAFSALSVRSLTASEASGYRERSERIDWQERRVSAEGEGGGRVRRRSKKGWEGGDSMASAEGESGGRVRRASAECQ